MIIYYRGNFRAVRNIDVNHDGISDTAIGCPYNNVAERVYVIYGTNLIF
jgi:hypothetical protein